MEQPIKMVDDRLQEARVTMDIDKLKEWSDNPKVISEEDFEQVKKDVAAEPFKPLIVLIDTDESGNSLGTGTVLGGNMRLRAMKEIGIKTVWVTTVTLIEEGDEYISFVNGKRDVYRFSYKTDGMLHYALKDNEMRGEYDSTKLIPLLELTELPKEEYQAMDTTELTPVDFAPSEPTVRSRGGDIDEDSEEDIDEEHKKEQDRNAMTTSITTIICPNCGHTFEEVK